MTDDDLRRRYARHLSATAPAGRGNCATPEALLALVERRGSKDDRLSTLDHAASCDACRRDLELLRSVHRAGAPRVERTTSRWRSFVPASYGRLAAAAALLVTIGALATRSFRIGGEAATMRGGSSTLALISPTGDVRGTEARTLTWHAASGAERYAVELLDAVGDSVFSAITPDTTLALPTGVELAADRDYLWSVRAVLRDGTHADARPLRFRLREP